MLTHTVTLYFRQFWKLPSALASPQTYTTLWVCNSLGLGYPGCKALKHAVKCLAELGPAIPISALSYTRATPLEIHSMPLDCNKQSHLFWGRNSSLCRELTYSITEALFWTLHLQCTLGPSLNPCTPYETPGALPQLLRRGVLSPAWVSLL